MACESDSASPASPPLRIGVFGGSFNPIHLGHTLLSITTQQTKPVDKVVLVPVYKHVRKTDLLPFNDRVAMCRLAVAPFAASGGVEVSTIEEEVGESNGAMLRALKGKYPPGTELFWICGDDVFRWIEKPKGLETMAEVSGLIVQRRLHKGGDGGGDKFYKEPLDEDRIRAIGSRLNLDIDFIYGELPHFSSTLVRRAPGTWRSFLPQSVAQYLDGRPELLAKLHDNLEADAELEAGRAGPRHPAAAAAKRRSSKAGEEEESSEKLAAAYVVRGLDAVHSLQFERGQTGLYLSIGSESLKRDLDEAMANTDRIVREIDAARGNDGGLGDFDEALSLSAELRRIPEWLSQDRHIVAKRASTLRKIEGADGWAGRYSLVEKFSSRIDVIIRAVIRALRQILDCDGPGTGLAPPHMQDAPDLIFQWSQGKEALGRLRALVSAGGPRSPAIVRSSVKMRRLVNQFIETKERRIARVLKPLAGESSGGTTGANPAAPDALHRMLESVILWEWSLMGCFAPSTPLELVHKLLAGNMTDSRGIGIAAGKQETVDFDVEMFFAATSGAIDLMLNEAKAIAAFSCARA